MLVVMRSGKATGAFIRLQHGEMSPEDYTALYESYGRQVGVRDPFAVSLLSVRSSAKHSGLLWTEGLSRDGAVFVIVTLPGTPLKAITKLRNHLKASRDVAGMSTYRIDNLIEFTWQKKMK